MTPETQTFIAPFAGPVCVLTVFAPVVKNGPTLEAAAAPYPPPGVASQAKETFCDAPVNVLATSNLMNAVGEALGAAAELA